jgi:hypothetical protein
MLKFCLKCVTLLVMTELLMGEFVAPAIVSKNDALANIGCWTGMVWMFIVGIAVYRLWLQLQSTEDQTNHKATDDLLRAMENPEEVWTAKQKEKENELLP